MIPQEVKNEMQRQVKEEFDIVVKTLLEQIAQLQKEVNDLKVEVNILKQGVNI